MVSEPADENGGTRIVGNNNKSTCGIDGGLARVISQGLDSGQSFKFIVESNKNTLFMLSQDVVVIVTLDNV